MVEESSITASSLFKRLNLWLRMYVYVLCIKLASILKRKVDLVYKLSCIYRDSEIIYVSNALNSKDEVSSNIFNGPSNSFSNSYFSTYGRHDYYLYF